MIFRPNHQFMQTVRQQLGDRLEQSGKIIRENIVGLLEEPKDGAQHRGMSRRSSEPGQPPASQTGELADSIRVDVVESRLEVHVNSPLFKARMLEAGTVRNAPRPFMLPGLIKSKDQIAKAMRGEGVSNG